MKAVLEFAAQELRNTGCGKNEWMGKLLRKIEKVIKNDKN